MTKPLSNSEKPIVTLDDCLKWLSENEVTVYFTHGHDTRRNMIMELPNYQSVMTSIYDGNINTEDFINLVIRLKNLP